MSWTIIWRVSGPRSMLGALVKFSWIYWKVPAALQHTLAFHVYRATVSDDLRGFPTGLVHGAAACTCKMSASGTPEQRMV